MKNEKTLVTCTALVLCGASAIATILMTNKFNYLSLVALVCPILTVFLILLLQHGVSDESE
jgi:uncharacterized membrane protein